MVNGHKHSFGEQDLAQCGGRYSRCPLTYLEFDFLVYFKPELIYIPGFRERAPNGVTTWSPVAHLISSLRCPWSSSEVCVPMARPSVLEMFLLFVLAAPKVSTALKISLFLREWLEGLECHLHTVVF